MEFSTAELAAATRRSINGLKKKNVDSNGMDARK